MDPSNRMRNDSLLTNYSDDLYDIHYAIIQGDVKKLNELCQQGGKNLNGKFMDDLDSQHLNMTPLALAAALNKLDLIEILLKYGADIDATFANLKTTALMTSSFHGHAPVVKFLLDRGADVRRTDVQKSTALGYCFGGSRSESVVKLLLQAGIDVNICNVLGMNACLLVSGYGNDSLLKMVLQAGADAKAVVNNFGHTPLHLAVLGKQSQVDVVTEKGHYSTAHYGLTRRNMKTILLDWATQNQSTFLNGHMLDSSFEKTGQFLEDLGAKVSSYSLRANDEGLWTEEEIMKHKIEMAAKYRVERLTNTIGHKKSGLIDSILSCGGKLGKQNKDAATQKMPRDMPALEPPPLLPDDKEREVELICNNFANSMRTLLDAGCQIDESEYTFGLTPLDIAILNGDTESIAMLLGCGADCNHLLKILSMTDLYGRLAAEKPDKKQIKDLLDYDPHLDLNMSFENANIPTRLSESENDDMIGDVGLTPLSVAAKAPDNCTVDIIKLFIKHGANPNHVGKGGRTTLGEACRWGNVRMVEFLIGLGADLEQPNPAFKGATPLHIAVREKQGKTVEYLISKGAAVDKMTSDGRTGLVAAAQEEDMAMVETLLRANLNTNFSNKSGFDYQITQQYQSFEKDIRLILQAISNKSSQLLEDEERERREVEKQARMESERLGRRSRALVSTSTDYSFDDYRKASGIYEEIKTDMTNTPSAIVPKIRKKKKKSVELSENPYEPVGEPQAMPRTAKVKEDTDGEPIYAQVKTKKKPTVEGSVSETAKSLAVEALDQNSEVIAEAAASGMANVNGQDKKRNAEAVIKNAAEFVGTVNGDAGDDQRYSYVPDSKIKFMHEEVRKAVKNIDIVAGSKEDDGVHSQGGAGIIQVKKKKRNSKKDKPDDDTNCFDVKLDSVIEDEVTSHVPLDSVDSVIIKPKARRRKTKSSTGSNDELDADQRNELRIDIREEKVELIGNVAEEIDTETVDIVSDVVPEVKTTKKKKRIKPSSVADE